MKRDLQAKLMMHMASKKQANEGFTLIELLVVIIIIGILAAIALPSLLGQVNKAKQSEARQNCGAMVRAQQAYLLGNDEFARTVVDLEIGIQTETANYKYEIDRAGASNAPASNMCYPKVAGSKLKGYAGLVGTKIGNAATNEVLSIGTVCEDKTIGTPVARVRFTAAADYNSTVNGFLKCKATGYKDLGA